MASKWLSMLLLVVLVACGAEESDGGAPAPLPTPSSSAPTTALESTTTSSSSTTTSSTSIPSTTLRSPDQEIVLSSDGLGIATVGDPVDDVFSLLIDRFGPPSSDWLFESPFDVPPEWEGDPRGPAACHEGTHTGLMCFDYLRTVDWEEVGLYVLFSDIAVNPEVYSSDDHDDFWIEVEPGFQGYGYAGGEGLLLYTADGITIGSTTADLLALGDRVTFWWDECRGDIEFKILDPGAATDPSVPTGEFITGSLNDGDLEYFETTGVPQEGTIVQHLGVGQRSSC